MIFLIHQNYILFKTIQIKIINNGEKSIPFLIEKLDSKFCMLWFDALEKITGEKFVGKFNELKESWKNWYENN